LLHRQPGLDAAYAVHRVSYPHLQPRTYAELADLGIRHLEQAGPGVVLAESFGGAVALMVALQRPQLVRRLVLVNTFAHYPRRFFIDMLGLVGPWLPNKPMHPATRSLRGLFFFGRGVPKAEQDAWWDLTADVPMLAYGHRFRLLAALDLRPRLREIDIPTVVFVSPDDWVVPPAAGRALARRLPRARLIEVPAGHAAMIDPRLNIAGLLETAELWRPANRA
jgi:3-oxoadipate enol-lactonase